MDHYGFRLRKRSHFGRFGWLNSIKRSRIPKCQPSPHSPKQHSSYCEALCEALSKPIAEIQRSLVGHGSKSAQVSCTLFQEERFHNSNTSERVLGWNSIRPSWKNQVLIRLRAIFTEKDNLDQNPGLPGEYLLMWPVWRALQSLGSCGWLEMMA